MILVFAIGPFLIAEQYCAQRYEKSQENSGLGIQFIKYRTDEDDRQNYSSEGNVSQKNEGDFSLHPDPLPVLRVVGMEPSFSPLPEQESCNKTSNPQ